MSDSNRPQNPARRRALQRAGAAALLAAAPAARATTGAAGAAADYVWRSVPFGGGGFVDGFVFHPRERGLLYARTDIGGAYRHDGLRGGWVPLLDHLPIADADLMGVLSLALDPQDPDRVYAACGLYAGPSNRDGALMASADRGLSWQRHELGIKIGGNMPGRGSGERLQVDPNLGRRLWLGSTQDGLRRSDDQGRRFEPVDFPGRSLSLVLCDARSGTPGQPTPTIWAGCVDQPGLYVSHDGGGRFVREEGPPAWVPQRAAFDAAGTLFVCFAAGEGAVAPNPSHAARGGVWKRSRDGRWTDITPVKPGEGRLGFAYSGLDTDPRLPGRLVVSTIERWTDGDDLFLSEDGGTSWTPLGARSRHDEGRHPWLAAYRGGRRRMGHWIADLKIDPFDGQRLLYGTGYGIWMTGNLGAPAVDWRFEVDGLEETATLGLRCPSGGATLLAAMGDVSGAAWDDVNRAPAAGLFRPPGETNRSVDFAELRPAVLARTSDHAEGGGYWSGDGGASWRPFGSDAPWERRTPSGRRAPTGRVAVSAGGGFLVWAPDRQPAMCSRDRGQTWQRCEGWPESAERSLEPVADRGVEGVFHVLDPARGEVRVSVDGGRHFQPAITGLPPRGSWQAAQLLVLPGRLKGYWVVLHDLLLLLPGADEPARTVEPVTGAWMAALGQGAPGGPSPHSLYLWGRVQAGGAAEEGVFRSDDDGRSFVRINDDRHRYGRLLAMCADPLDHGSVYLAPHGRGIVVGRPRG